LLRLPAIDTLILSPVAFCENPYHRLVLVLACFTVGKEAFVRRCGYLLRVRRVRPQSVLVCGFNRQAAVELRHRPAELAGPDARGVTVLTYHGLASSGHPQ
jgi:superfamily I DNA/RNA helicase